MPTLDIVSRVNYTELDNAINNTQKAIATRFDFRNSVVEIEVNKKDKKINRSPCVRCCGGWISIAV